MESSYRYWQGEKVLLRLPQISDLDMIVADYRKYVGSDQDWLAGNLWLPESEDDCRQSWEKYFKDEAKGENLRFLICNTDGEYIGGIDTFNTDRRHGGFMYGIGLNPEYRGSGHAAEAIVLLLDFFFNHLRYHRCEVLVYAFNPRSARFHEKIGFVLYGRQSEAIFVSGKYHDVLRYELLAQQFNGLYPQRLLL